MVSRIFLLVIAAIVGFVAPVGWSAAEVKYSNKPGTYFDYPSVDATMQALKANPEIAFRNYRGWTIADDRTKNTVWSFTNPSHPANPAVVKRWPVEKEGVVSIQMNILCQADKNACDKLVAEFQALNEQMRAYLQKLASEKQRAQQSNPSIGPEYDPSDQQRIAAAEAKDRYFSFIDSEQFGDAYEMNTPGLKAMIDRATFTTM